jgi:hypothetical protein
MKIAPKRNWRFIVACLGIILTNTLQAQKLLLEPSAATPHSIIGASSAIGGSSTWNAVAFQPKNISMAGSSATDCTNYDGLRPLSADYYQKNIGIFCKMEWSFEKYTRLPLRFRLGSLEYVNHLEGK